VREPTWCDRSASSTRCRIARWIPRELPAQLETDSSTGSELRSAVDRLGLKRRSSPALRYRRSGPGSDEEGVSLGLRHEGVVPSHAVPRAAKPPCVIGVEALQRFELGLHRSRLDAGAAFFEQLVEEQREEHVRFTVEEVPDRADQPVTEPSHRNEARTPNRGRFGPTRLRLQMTDAAAERGQRIEGFAGAPTRTKTAVPL